MAVLWPFSVETERLEPAEEETPEAVAVAAVLQIDGREGRM